MQEKSKTPQRLFGCTEQPAAPSEIEFREEDYALVWASLVGAIGESNYFSGSVECELGGATARLTTTLIIYRDREHPKHPITKIVPIWWEMTTLDASKNKTLNNFSFRELLSKMD